MTQILNITSFYNLQATNIQTCIGSVLYCGIRTANQNFLTNFTSGPYEIVSLVGTISQGSMPHIHISLSDKYGNMVGGHLPSLEERQFYNQTDFSCPIYTTAEIVLTENINLVFQRPVDPQTTYDELQISYRNSTIVA
ncbi:DNA-binding protein (macronuclear) [Tetrahymena thermophila SB210]|uniref:DNA-binding protein n=1 Tax=Tetrahymena thermophila (strain SB210) TaxID=312017 RepID=Q22NS6_TETTS|nr:DNA-binding protein [Tetrahymena thermophila SB210]EAR86709.2 DNA-binding protein [Tetrahymena thermophila SB210]|eukprot:XP_977304.2 DNA-binding protein [Tetrahymena thermophila SB210]